MLNEDQLTILRAVNDGQASEVQIVQQTGLALELIRYYLEVLEKEDYIQAIHGRDYKADLYYQHCQLRPKGKVAATQPDKLLNSPGSTIINLSIVGSSVNAPIGIFQDSTGNTFNANQNINSQVAETIKIIDSFYQAVEALPNNERELSIVHLNNLKEEIQSPSRRDPKKIRAYFLAFLSIVSAATTFLTNTTDFMNNATDFGQRIGIEIPKIPKL
ncbi:MAG: hypothetical protein RBJ76_09210 [Stenomitos frigidus ULC029]